MSSNRLVFSFLNLSIYNFSSSLDTEFLSIYCWCLMRPDENLEKVFSATPMVDIHSSTDPELFFKE